MRSIEYSQIARKKLKALRDFLKHEYGEEISKKTVKEITSMVRNLSKFPDSGVSISKAYDSVETDYRYIFRSRWITGASDNMILV